MEIMSGTDMKTYTILNEKGFTLIELIAVLVILGILVSFALPKFFALQEASREQAVKGAIAGFKATVSQEYAKQLLTNPITSEYSPTSPAVVGDFTGEITLDSGDKGKVWISLKAGPPWFSESIPGHIGSFRLYGEE